MFSLEIYGKDSCSYVNKPKRSTNKIAFQNVPYQSHTCKEGIFHIQSEKEMFITFKFSFIETKGLGPIQYENNLNIYVYRSKVNYRINIGFNVSFEIITLQFETFIIQYIIT